MSPAQLQRVRRRLKLTQRELAERIGVSIGAVRHWEQERRAIPEPVARLLHTMTNSVDK